MMNIPTRQLPLGAGHGAPPPYDAPYDRVNPTGGPSGNGLYGSATSTPLVAGPDKNGG